MTLAFSLFLSWKYLHIFIRYVIITFDITFLHRFGKSHIKDGGSIVKEDSYKQYQDSPPVLNTLKLEVSFNFNYIIVLLLLFYYDYYYYCRIWL